MWITAIASAVHCVSAPVQEVVDTLKREEREGGKGRKWRGAFRRIQQQLLDLEADSKALELVFPQVLRFSAYKISKVGLSGSGSESRSR